MNNIINSQMTNTDNIIAAKSIGSASGKNPGFIEAPQFLPKYSISEKLAEQDTFRKTIIQSNYQAKQRKNSIKKFLTVAGISVITAIGYAICKKTV